jgi:hypothetical protein
MKYWATPVELPKALKGRYINNPGCKPGELPNWFYNAEGPPERYGRALNIG